ncbi:YciI family protein [Seohaeicola nanhaiensis]|uniref:YciI family protein n=1 Tax=Seohaeicola nanhaiensis TaxID=1387282 RepID=A0ABV9KE30_9RHOB
MDYIVLFEDAEGKGDLRAAHMQDHLAFLKAHPQILRAGPLSDRDTPTGGLWHLRADSTAEVEKLVRADPFWPTGLRKSHRILDWSLVHPKPEGKNGG